MEEATVRKVVVVVIEGGEEEEVQGSSAQERTVRALRAPVLAAVLVGIDRAATDDEHSLSDGQVKTVETA